MSGECGEKENELGGQAKRRKFIKGKRGGGLTLKKSQPPALLVGPFYTPWTENWVP